MKTKKKKVFTRNGTLFLGTDLRSDAHQSQIIGGDADEDHTQVVGGYTVKLLGGIYPPILPCFGTTVHNIHTNRQNRLNIFPQNTVDVQQFPSLQYGVKSQQTLAFF